jgi:hypothetical protein
MALASGHLRILLVEKSAWVRVPRKSISFCFSLWKIPLWLLQQIDWNHTPSGDLTFYCDFSRCPTGLRATNADMRGRMSSLSHEELMAHRFLNDQINDWTKEYELCNVPSLSYLPTICCVLLSADDLEFYDNFIVRRLTQTLTLRVSTITST